MKLPPTLFAVALSLGPLHAGAQTQVPGLWEHSFNMKSQDGETEKALAAMQQQMAVMPTDQRKTQQMTMEMAGKWLGADCGDVKPRPVPVK